MARVKTRAPSELMFSLFALIIFVIAVHSVYVTVIRPKAAAVLVAQREGMKKDPNYVSQRSIYVVLKDWEQESEVILGLWALAIIGYKAWHTRSERKLLDQDLVHVPEGMRILPEDTREYARPLEALPPGEAGTAAARAAGRAVPLRCDTQHTGRVGCGARRVQRRSRPLDLRAVESALHRLGDPRSVHRHRARYRRRSASP
jgi:hypothetical protein